VDVKKTMRVGCNPFYPIPAQIDEDHQAEWFIGRMAELGCRSAQTRGIRNDPELLKRVRALCEEKDVELDCGAAGVFGLVGEGARAAQKQLVESIGVAKQVGTNIVRTGYGGLRVAMSRFSRERPLAEHCDWLVANLRVAAKIIEDNGMLLAIENHCDFTGRQWAEMFAAVGSKSVGAALDTANGFTVFCDPDDDVQDLAPYTITTHLKDMRMVDARTSPYFEITGPVIPMLPIGCTVGDGDVDIPLCIETLVKECPHAEGLHLIIELGWDPIQEGMTAEESRVDLFEKSVKYLQGLIK